MTDVRIHIDAKKLLADTSSLVEMYINGHMQAQLSETAPTYSGTASISGDNANIVLIRRYHAASVPAKDGGGNILVRIVKKTVGFLSRLLLAYVPADPFDCVYELEERFFVADIRNDSAITFLCRLDSSGRCPKFASQADNCHIVSAQKEYIISKEEIKENYREQKKYIKILGFGSSALLFLLMILGIIADNQITALFSGIIAGIIICCVLLSLNGLRKKSFFIKENKMNTENDFQSNKKISKGQEAWKALQILLIFVAVICALWGAVVCLLTYWAKASVERQKLPTSGDYYCEELDATLHIVDSSFYLRLQDGREQEVYPSVSGHIRDGSLEHVFDFNAVYMWNQKKDWIELEIDTYPEPFQEGKKYWFKRVSQDSVSSEGRCTKLT